MDDGQPTDEFFPALRRSYARLQLGWRATIGCRGQADYRSLLASKPRHEAKNRRGNWCRHGHKMNSSYFGSIPESFVDFRETVRSLLTSTRERLFSWRRHWSSAFS